MILLTGAAGFIGSYLLGNLNGIGRYDIVIVDDFERSAKQPNLRNKIYEAKIQRQDLWQWLAGEHPKIEYVIHLGARTDTAEQDQTIFDELNLSYTKRIWEYCTQEQIPLIYASSAATYGDGSLGFVDDHALVPRYAPLNPYGWSKQTFDQWALTQTETPPAWFGLKFFNVYGPNEYHKGRMASVVYHTYKQISETGKMKLFRSHREDFADGEQKRDFIYVQDLAQVIRFLMKRQPDSGLYNLGTGQARTFNDLVKNVFSSLLLEPKIEYIDTPADIRDAYQYFTEADMSKFRATGYRSPFLSLEEGVQKYVQQFLSLRKYY
ncbi:MAG: ADP-glyceromanno-heptose 6-epimerase [Bacteroidota bacterium]